MNGSNEKERAGTMSRRGKAARAVVIAAVAVGASSIAAYAAVERSSDAEPTVARGGFGLRGGPIPQTMPAVLTRRYGVFRREARPGDSLEGYIADDSSYVRVAGMNRALARRIQTSPEQPSKVWIVPIADGTCLMFLPPDAIGPGGSCGPGRESDPYRSADSSGNRDGAVDVFGLVRDGVTSAEIVFADGTSAEWPVEDNVYAFHVKKKPKDVRLVDPEQGRVTVPIAGY